MQSLIFTIFVAFAGALELHNRMTIDELRFHFGTTDINQLPPYSVINLKLNTIHDDGIQMEVDIFGEVHRFQFEPNSYLLAPTIRIRTIGGEVESSVRYKVNTTGSNCHFVHNGINSAAAISTCNNSTTAFVRLAHGSFEATSLNKRLTKMVGDFQNPCVLKRVAVVLPTKFDSIARQKRTTRKRTNRSTKELRLTVEVGVFFDAAAYKVFAPFYNYDDDQLTDMILGYMNGVQSLYRHESLGTPVDISIVYIELMRRQPPEMPHYNGERSALLGSFCRYQKSINPIGDRHPHHWDMGLYISGLDFFAYEHGRPNTATMGLATLGGVCQDRYACVIAEFGTVNVLGKPYPSAGFTSVYIMAHEIGHNLGMHHDAVGNECTSEGFVMSPSRGTEGETLWSTCSADIIRTLGDWAKCLHDKPTNVSVAYNSWKYEGYPGQRITAKQQCQLLLVDKKATASQNGAYDGLCQNLHCRTPNRSGYYYAGPALPGTDCATDKWCMGGSCVKRGHFVGPHEYRKGGWSEWTVVQPCRSDCLERSRGYARSERQCDRPVPINTDEGCEGLAYGTVICDDVKLCKNQTVRKSVTTYAAGKCKEFSEKVVELDSSGSIGLQALHESTRLWMACAIFCKRRNSTAYYSPRLELNDVGIDPYFPDGTWCHADDNRQNYYCLQHHCLPETFQISKTTSVWQLGDDVPAPNNAQNVRQPSRKVQEYFSISADRIPFRTELLDTDVEMGHGEEDNRDYIELPADE